MRHRPAVHPRARRLVRPRPWTVAALLLGILVMHGITTTPPALATEHPQPSASAAMGSGPGTHPCHPDPDGHPPAHEHCLAVVSTSGAPSAPDLSAFPAVSAALLPLVSVQPTGSAVDPSSWPRPPDLSDLCVLRT